MVGAERLLGHRHARFPAGRDVPLLLRSPNGQEMWGRFVYREIVKPERIVSVTSFSDEKGGMTRHFLGPDWPLEMLSTFTFAEEGRGTKLTIKWVPLNPTEAERKTFEAGHGSMRQAGPEPSTGSPSIWRTPEPRRREFM